MKEWIKSWNASKNPSKQRKYRYNAPLHIKQKLMHVNLSLELRKKYDYRQFGIRKGDTVTIMRGDHKKKSGKVSKVMLKVEKVYIEGVETIKKDGSTVQVPIKPSNLRITSLDLEDKKRRKKLEMKIKDKEKK
tara:strand:+ start:116 stop:514 length:399 start_codon:yes stop_codon:yes gene_type:complete